MPRWGLASAREEEGKRHRRAGSLGSQALYNAPQCLAERRAFRGAIPKALGSNFSSNLGLSKLFPPPPLLPRSFPFCGALHRFSKGCPHTSLGFPRPSPARAEVLHVPLLPEATPALTLAVPHPALTCQCLKNSSLSTARCLPLLPSPTFCSCYLVPSITRSLSPGPRLSVWRQKSSAETSRGARYLYLVP